LARAPVAARMLERAALARIVPFAIYMGFILVADVLSRLGVTDAQLRWLYPVKIGAVVVALLFYRRDYGELAARLSSRAALVAVAAGVLVLVLWINLNLPWMRVGASGGFDPRTNGAIDWSLVAIRLMGAALVVPLMEELFWRSFLMRWVQAPDFLNVTPAQVKVRAFVVTVILFGIEHNLWLAGMVAGLVYNLLYVRSSTLWSPIVAHAVTNGLLGLWVIHTANWTYW
jgi:CAAX prenyl protease-like protein